LKYPGVKNWVIYNNNQNMPERSKKKPKRSRDLNVLASEIVRAIAEGEPEASAQEEFGRICGAN
jgi:hypothetical protein